MLVDSSLINLHNNYYLPFIIKYILKFKLYNFYIKNYLTTFGYFLQDIVELLFLNLDLILILKLNQNINFVF